MFIFFTLMISLLSWSGTFPPFESVIPGLHYMCGHQDGKLTCWGDNRYGQASTISDFSGVKKIELADRFGCVLDAVGVTCWGQQQWELPAELAFSESVDNFEISDGICGLSAGNVYCGQLKHQEFFKNFQSVTDFGMNQYISCVLQSAKLTCFVDESTREGRSFKLPENFGTIRDISISEDKACVLNEERQVICWGHNDNLNFSLPFETDSIQASSSGACALSKSGEFFCHHVETKIPSDFGPVTEFILTQGSYEDGFCLKNKKNEFHCEGKYLPPVIPPVVKKPILMASDYFHTYFVDESSGMLVSSMGTVFSQRLPQIQTYNAISLTASSGVVCYVDDTGGHCWTTTNPREIDYSLQGIQMKSLHPVLGGACAVLQNRDVQCFGGAPNPPMKLKNVVKLVSENNYACSLDQLNHIECWGARGNPQFSNKLKVLDLSASFKNACAIFEDQSIECWGDPLAPNMTPPTHLTNMTGIFIGRDFACATGDTDLFCWGESANGKTVPPKVVGKIHRTTVGVDHACFLDDEKVKCWGNNKEGQYQFFYE